MLTLPQSPGLGAFLAGGTIDWGTVGLSADELREFCEMGELWPLLAWRLREHGASGWPADVGDEALRRGREAAALELVSRRETVKVLSALDASGTRVLLMKGTALAYHLYPAPSLRLRDDTDVLIDPASRWKVMDVLSSLGYTVTPLAADALCQFEMQRHEEGVTVHAIDVHWHVSSQGVFQDLISFESARRRAVRVDALGSHAWMLGEEDALLLACVHPAMHHRGELRPLWLYDIHLLAGALGSERLIRFAARAKEQRMTAVCRHALAAARAAFGTAVPDAAWERLEAAEGPEASAAYLDPRRRWHQDVIASLRASRGLGARVRRARAVLFPSAHYMFAREEQRGRRPPRWTLPVLYARRQARGAWNVLAGKK